MPEGHAVHRVAREHGAALAGRALAASSPQGRAAAAAARIDGRVLDRVEAHGKHLFYRFDGGAVLHVHLGRYGEFGRFEPPAPEPRATVRLRLATPAAGSIWSARRPARSSIRTRRRRSWPGWGPTRCARTPTRSSRGRGCAGAAPLWARRCSTSA